ncbi:MAG: hypothetical protein OEW67_02825 [Cyclobacteriaceae bacterium]|nr:hypothetical protein [Cyclobacteriaceae bacterium]
MTKKPSKENIFHKESNVLENAKRLVEKPSTSTKQLAEEYLSLSKQYEQLLKETKVLTSVGDRLHRKLGDANQELQKQKSEIEEINEELKTNNNVLQDTINELIKARIGQKASSIVLLIAVLLFVVSEVVLEPIIEKNTDSEYIGLLLKGIIALLLKPIDVLVEWLLLRKTLGKMKRFELVSK